MPKMNDFPVSRGLLTCLFVLMLAGCSPTQEDGAGPDQDALDNAVRALVRGEDRIGAEALADLLVAGREPVSIIDIRPRSEFDAGHIEGARYSDATALVSGPGRAVLGNEERLVLVSGDGVQAAQVVALLRAAGVMAYSLSGGYDGWRSLIDGGVSGEAADREAAQAEAKRRAVACRLEGDYVAAAGLAVKADDGVRTGGGYVPPVQPVTAEPPADPLGLGLGLGLGEGVAPVAPQQERKRLRVREGC